MECAVSTGAEVVVRAGLLYLRAGGEEAGQPEGQQGPQDAIRGPPGTGTFFFLFLFSISLIVIYFFCFEKLSQLEITTEILSKKLETPPQEMTRGTQSLI
jgi:amino acid transporter